MTLRPFLVAGIALACGLAAAAPPPLHGKVTRVIDGQTLLLAAEGGAVQVKLTGIEAPLPCQPWGPEARNALKDWVLNREVVATPVGPPDGARVMAKVTLEGEDLSRRLVEEGHAWSVRIKWDQGPYVKQERMAQALSRGLHAAGGAQPPQQFRRSHGPCPGPT